MSASSCAHDIEAADLERPADADGDADIAEAPAAHVSVACEEHALAKSVPLTEIVALPARLISSHPR